ncbi:MAG: ATP-dependent helicase, partial [Chloroflexota bacterium]|nr:ATP-dependent helicase [Chloroflexota bacterium]
GDRDEILTTLLGDWLQFYGPVSFDFIRTTLGIENGPLMLALEYLVDSQKLITGQLVTDGPEDDFCDSENFEILLRMARADAVPGFEPLDIEWLPLFLAQHQGLAKPESDIDGLAQRIEQLVCYPAPASLWETEIFPARVQTYSASWLDTLMQESDLRWVGTEKGRIAFCFESDLDLMADELNEGVPGASESEIDDLLPDAAVRYDFPALLQVSKATSSELADRLWNAVWGGQVTNDTFIALRRGIQNKFKVPAVTGSQTSAHSRGRRIGGRTGFARWKGAMPYSGNWFRLPRPEISDDLLETEERRKDRARLLLDRYGILFRELLANESGSFRWAGIFRALRLMELSGEVLAGYFFEGIPGPQFISPQAFRMLQRQLPADAVYWINATDPVSLCGLQVDAIRGTLPKRVAGTHIVYRGKEPVSISQRNGKSLIFNCPPDDPQIQEYLGFLRHLLLREFQPLRRISIESINGEEASRSPYVDALRIGFEVMIEHRQVVLYRQRG